MADTNTKKVMLHEDETVPFRWGRYVSIKQMDRDAVIRGTCQDCGLIHTQTVSQLVKDSAIAMATVDDLEEIMKCRRESCRGDMLFDVDEANSADIP